jgi:hypothetical protein
MELRNHPFRVSTLLAEGEDHMDNAAMREALSNPAES